MQTYLGNKLLNVRTLEDALKEHSLNRTLVIQGFPSTTDVQEIL